MVNIHLIGHLGRNAEVKQMPNSTTQLIEFSVAHTEKWTDNAGQKQERTTWFTVNKWVQSGGSIAVAQYLKQGTQVFVTGTVEARGYKARDKDAQGNDIIKAEMIVKATHIELLGGRSENTVPGSPQPTANAQQGAPAASQQQQGQSGGGWGDNLPF